MVHKNYYRPFLKPLTLTAITSLVVILMVSATSDQKVRTLDDESKHCLSCHGETWYTLTDTSSGDSVRKIMYAELRIDKSKYLEATHGGFKCTDCHSSDYTTVPHPESVKFESQYTCLDCHGGDEQYASFHFETIEEEFSRSVHADSLKGTFTCWSCHNPHTYKLSGPNADINRKVAMDNEMCLTCHGNKLHFEDLAGKTLPNLISRHDWLPNQALHFEKVRCVDCHGAQNDSIAVAHLIKPAKQAVKKCVECHSTNSLLMASLYKHSVREQRSKYGFYNGVIMNEAYVIGANRNYYLNFASISMFALALIGIFIHASLRIAKSRKNANK